MSPLSGLTFGQYSWSLTKEKGGKRRGGRVRGRGRRRGGERRKRKQRRSDMTKMRE